MQKSHFFAYISKIRWLQRWGLKRNTISENVMEHSFEVATIAHALALIKNRLFGGNIDANQVAVTALYHDVSEVITGDMPSPIKYHSSDITKAYKSLERKAEQELFGLLPAELQADFQPLLLESYVDDSIHELVKAADTLAAFVKCQLELNAGNQEFKKAAEQIEQRLIGLKLPEVDYFMKTFFASYSLTLDELMHSDSTES
ncbi:MAG: 5'-deoxynucleotidase [Gammaproteobacteria bacterium]|nr:5'-deoxynucleotidase [Gammaproteobacteria bacterium]NVK88013.1 5'-deoxynucleotidase [Gammaproteobacteria bacterium]